MSSNGKLYGQHGSGPTPSSQDLAQAAVDSVNDSELRRQSSPRDPSTRDDLSAIVPQQGGKGSKTRLRDRCKILVVGKLPGRDHDASASKNLDSPRKSKFLFRLESGRIQSYQENARNDPGTHEPHEQEPDPAAAALRSYMPKSERDTRQILDTLSTTIMRAAYNLVPLVGELKFDTDIHRDKYSYILTFWEGHPSGTHQTIGSLETRRRRRVYVVAAIFSKYLWEKIEDYSIFTEDAEKVLKEIAAMEYPRSEDEELKEQQYATDMEEKHGVSRELKEYPMAAERVKEKMKPLLDMFVESPPNNVEVRNQIMEIINHMGSEVWKAAINLKNQKGTITYSFSGPSHMPFPDTDMDHITHPVSEREVQQTEERLMWFPLVTITKPLQTYDNTGENSQTYSYGPEYASIHNSDLDFNGVASLGKDSSTTLHVGPDPQTEAKLSIDSSSRIIQDRNDTQSTPGCDIQGGSEGTHMSVGEAEVGVPTSDIADESRIVGAPQCSGEVMASRGTDQTTEFNTLCEKEPESQQSMINVNRALSLTTKSSVHIQYKSQSSRWFRCKRFLLKCVRTGVPNPTARIPKEWGGIQPPIRGWIEKCRAFRCFD